MRSVFRRASACVLAASLLVTSTGVAFGQSEAEVESARAEAEQAAARRRGAAAETVGREQALVAAYGRYVAVTTELSDMTFELTALVDEARAAERALRDRRTRARRVAADAYVAAAAALLPGLHGARDLGDLALAADLRARVATARDERLPDLETASAELEGAHAQLDEARRRQKILRDDAEAMLPELVDLVAHAHLDEAFAEDEEAGALARYELAVAELEAALRSVSPGALRWRTLVERYFPDGTSWAALQVIACESGGNPFAVNEESGATGLFQFLEGTWVLAAAGAGYAGAQRTDAEASVAAAAWLVARSDSLSHPRGPWGHWQCQPSAERSQPGHLPLRPT